MCLFLTGTTLFPGMPRLHATVGVRPTMVERSNWRVLYDGCEVTAYVARQAGDGLIWRCPDTKRPCSMQYCPAMATRSNCSLADGCPCKMVQCNAKHQQLPTWKVSSRCCCLCTAEKRSVVSLSFGCYAHAVRRHAHTISHSWGHTPLL